MLTPSLRTTAALLAPVAVTLSLLATPGHSQPDVVAVSITGAVVAGVTAAATPRPIPAPPVPAVSGVDVTAVRTAAGVTCRLLPDRLTLCSHGDDRHLTRDSAASSGTGQTSSGSGPLGCYGTGSDGSRVQAVYARARGSADRYGQLLPSFRSWASGVDAVFDRSARQTGGRRHVRFATTPPSGGTCSLSVARVVLEPAAFGSFDATVQAVRRQGLNAPAIKYLIWADANAQCGIASAYRDDRPGADNANNGAMPSYARVDRRCWGSAEAHEVLHMLGGVQKSAPHSTDGFHCNDGADVMCYADGSARSTQRSVCGSAQAQLLDCRHDDYFSTAPPAGSYLSTHWNTARSAFLAPSLTGPAAAPSPAPTQPPPSSPPPQSGITLPKLPALPTPIALPGGAS